MSKLIRIGLCLGLLCVQISACIAQVTLGVYSQNHYTINSYGGLETPVNSQDVHFQLSGTDINYKNWSFTMQVTGPILPQSSQNIANKPFPIDKILVRFTGDNAVSPMLSEALGKMHNIPMQQTEFYLVRKSPSPLYLKSNYTSYKEVRYFFQFRFLSGDYLTGMRNVIQWQPMKYSFPVRYTLYNELGRVIAVKNDTYTIQVDYNLSGKVVEEIVPEFSIQIMPEAQDARLEFSDQKSYLEGVEKTYLNALKISSYTDYEVKVKAVNADFQNATGAKLPLNIVDIKCIPASGSTRTTTKGWPLSNMFESHILGISNMQGYELFNLQYKISIKDKTIINAPSGNYATPVIFQLLPL